MEQEAVAVVGIDTGDEEDQRIYVVAQDVINGEWVPVLGDARVAEVENALDERYMKDRVLMPAKAEFRFEQRKGPRKHEGRIKSVVGEHNQHESDEQA